MTKRLFLLGLLASACIGCVSYHTPPMDRRVTVAEDLGTCIWVTDVRCAKGNSPYATFQANVVNNTSSDLGVEWKVVWLDANGIAIDSIVSTWNKLMIPAKDIQALKNTAPQMGAVDMLFYVRRLR